MPEENVAEENVKESSYYWRGIINQVITEEPVVHPLEPSLKDYHTPVTIDEFLEDLKFWALRARQSDKELGEK